LLTTVASRWCWAVDVACCPRPWRHEVGRGEDEAKFIDFSRSTIFITEEHEIFDR
jgi:hypothetical protein